MLTTRIPDQKVQPIILFHFFYSRLNSIIKWTKLTLFIADICIGSLTNIINDGFKWKVSYFYISDQLELN